MRELALGCDLNLNKYWTHKHTQHPPANTHTVIIYELFISWMHCCAVSVCVCAYVCTCVCVSGVPGYTPDQHACIKVRGYAFKHDARLESRGMARALRACFCECACVCVCSRECVTVN